MVDMAPSRLLQFSLPVIGTGTAKVLMQAGSVPTRVVVRNTSTVAIFLAFDPNDIKDASSSSMYRLPASTADVLLLAPFQSLFGMGAAGGGTVSVAISEAFPVRLGNGS